MSLLETIIAISIASTLALACFTSYTDYYQHQELKHIAQNFISDIDYAKTLSSINGNTVYLCASLDHQTCNLTWRGDLIIFTSNSPPKIDNILKIAPPIPEDIGVTMNFGGFTQNSYLRFTNSGESTNAGNFGFSKNNFNKEFKIGPTGIVSETTSA